jgi:hypothetical protein
MIGFIGQRDREATAQVSRLLLISSRRAASPTQNGSSFFLSPQSKMLVSLIHQSIQELSDD